MTGPEVGYSLFGWAVPFATLDPAETVACYQSREHAPPGAVRVFYESVRVPPQPDDRPREPLPDPARPRAGHVGGAHPETARRAARTGRYRFGSQCYRVLAIIAARGDLGANAAELAAETGLSRNQIGARLVDLRLDGWAERAIAENGFWLERPTDDLGNTGIVHVLTPRARLEWPLWKEFNER